MSMTISREVHLLVWILNAVASVTVAADDGMPGVRHVLKGEHENAAYCSMLAPLSWQIEQSHDDETHRDRYLLHPPDGNYPYLMVDARRVPNDELDRELDIARRLPQVALLDEDVSTRCFDAARSAVWQIEESERLLTIRVQLLREPMLTLQFAGAQPVDPAEQQTLLKVIDTIDFDLLDPDAGNAMTPVATSAAITQPKFLLQTESEVLAGRGRGYWIAGAVAGVLLTLVSIERTLRRRDEARRLREVEEAVQARQKLQQAEDEWTPRPRRPNRKRRSPSSQ